MIKKIFNVNNFTMKRLLVAFQELIKCTLVFALSFIWLRFSPLSLWLNIAISLLITAIFEILTLILKHKRIIKKSLKTTEEEEAENMFFSLSTTANPVNFFYNLVSIRHKNLFKTKDYIKILHGNKSTILYPFIKFKKLIFDDVTQIIRKTSKLKPNKIVIACNEFESELTNFIKNFDIEIVVLDKYETYRLLYKEYEFYPEKSLSYKKEKTSFKNLVAFSFTRSKAKGYLLTALIIMLSTMFIKMNVYYSVIASILVLFALFSYFNPKFNSSIKKELL